MDRVCAGLLLVAIISVDCAAMTVDVNFGPFEGQPKGTTREFGGLAMTLDDAFAPKYQFLAGSWQATGDVLRMDHGVLSNTGTYTNLDSGVSNPSIDSESFHAAFGPDREEYSVNTGEGVVFSFSRAVKVVAARLFEFDEATDAGEIAAAGMMYQFSGGVTENIPTGSAIARRFDLPFGSALIPAGSQITMKNTGSESTDFLFYILSLEYAEPGATPTGDYNRDGRVDAADYTVWRDSVGNLVPLCSGADANCNGFVENSEFETWKNHFGEMASVAGGIGGAGSVPEPSTILLLLGLMLWIGKTR